MMSRYIRFVLLIFLGFGLFGLKLDIATTQGNQEFQIDYIHEVQINGETAQAIVTGTANLETGIVVVEGNISNYISGYRFWPSSWITLIMASVLPAVSLERGEARNLFTVTDGQLGYEVRALTENEFAAITTDIQVSLEGDTIVARLNSEGQSNYPDLVGMEEGVMTILQTPNPDGGFTETGTEQLITSNGEVIEIPHYAEFTGVELPFPQQRTVHITVREVSEDFTHVVLEYEGVVEPASVQAFERSFFYGIDGQVPVNLSLNSIGVIANEEGMSERVATLAQRFELRVLEEMPGDFFVLGVTGQTNLETLRRIARELKRAGDNLFRETGLVITMPTDPETPILLTNEFIVLFRAGVTSEEIEAYNRENNVDIVNADPFVENQYILSTENSSVDTLTMANQYQESNLTVFAHPNLWQLYQPMEYTPNDPLFNRQWYHQNTGFSGSTFVGTQDADVDTSWAWDISRGTANTVIAIVDDGFDLGHQDLTPNLYSNPGEIAGNNVDDDGNGFIDDVQGWDFTSYNPSLCSPSNLSFCGDNDPRAEDFGGQHDNHGTAVAGIAIARGDNAIGVVGSCPMCHFLPIRTTVGRLFYNSDAEVMALFNYLQSPGLGVRVISNSWGHDSPSGVVTPAVATAINNAANAGIVVLFAGGNQNDSGWCSASFPSLESVIVVSSSTSLDRKAVGDGSPNSGSALGNCIDVLAPSYHGDPGTRAVFTTDRSGNDGYSGGTLGDYYAGFGGTSAATPLTAGVVGLLRSVNPQLTPVQVQRLLQDTTDRIEPGTALYAENIGFSSPASGIATHSWGRINAYEAVRVAAPVADGGRGGVDIFIRDNRLDWGNTTGYLNEQGSNVLFESPRGSIPHWESVDIKVDAPPYAAIPPTTPAAFDAFVHENPISGEVNRVYVRVRNRGPVTANNVAVTLQWAFAGTALPSLPSDFWTNFTTGGYTAGSWNFIGSQSVASLPYSGASLAGCPSRTQPACAVGDVDNSQIVQFNWTGPALDPTKPGFRHFCLFAVIDSLQDPVDPESMNRFAPDAITPNDNNVTHRNVAVQDPTAGGMSPMGFYVRNPFDVPIRTMIRIDLGDPRLQENWGVDLSGAPLNQPFTMEPGEEIQTLLYVALPDETAMGTVSVVQLRLDQEMPEVLGGMTFEFRPPQQEETRPTGQVMWINHLDLVPGDSTVITSFNATSSEVGSGLGGLVVESTTTGDTDSFGGNKVVQTAIQVPPGYLIMGVRVCYELSSSNSYITQIRLAQVQDPPTSAVVLLDDARDLTDIGPACVDSIQTIVNPLNGPLTLSLGVNFGDISDRIVIRGIGIYLEPVPR